MSGRSSAKTPVETLSLEDIESIVTPGADDSLSMFSGGMVVVADLHPETDADLSNIADLVEVTKEIPLPPELARHAPSIRDVRVPIDGSDPDEISAVRVIASVSSHTVAEVPPSPRASVLAPSPTAPVPPVDDGRMRDAEVLIGQGRWSRVVELLAPEHGPTPTPAGIGLLYAIALRECEVGGASTGQRSTTEAGHLAIEAIANLMGVSPQSPAAILVARRLLRRNTWRSTPAPPPRTSVLIALTAVVMGSVVGWFLGPGRASLLHVLYSLHLLH